MDHAEHLEFDDQQFQEDERTAHVTLDNGAVEVHASGGSPTAAEEMSAVFELAVEDEFDKD